MRPFPVDFPGVMRHPKIKKPHMGPRFRDYESLQCVYKPLQEDEIRLLVLFPGSFDDDIHIRLTHTPFLVPKPTPRQASTLIEARKSVSQDFRVDETWGGQFISWDSRNMGRPVHQLGQHGLGCHQSMVRRQYRAIQSLSRL